jgi:hypothetical protein
MFNNQDNQQPTEQDDLKQHFWIALVCFILGAVALGLSFTVLGVYSLFASMILELCSVTFLNVQKKHNYFFFCKVLRVASYVVMLAAIGMVLGLIAYKVD